MDQGLQRMLVEGAHLAPVLRGGKRSKSDHGHNRNCNGGLFAGFHECVKKIARESLVSRAKFDRTRLMPIRPLQPLQLSGPGQAGVCGSLDRQSGSKRELVPGFRAGSWDLGQ